jgi:hypothetical protein
MSESFTLQHPVKVKGHDHSALTLRRPKGRDLELMETSKGANTTRSFQLIADLAQVDIEVIRELDPTDLEQINDWLEPILDPKGRASREASN